MDLSIVIPSYKEEYVLADTVRYLNLLAEESDAVQTWEFILVVEKSETKTLGVARALEASIPNVTVLPNDRKYGKGYSVRRGVLASQGNMVLVNDADLPVELKKYWHVAHWLLQNGNAGAVYMTAFGDKTCSRKRGFFRSKLTLGLFALRNGIMGHRVSDTQLGCKLYDGGIARRLFSCINENGFMFELEMTDLLEQAGYVIEECAVRLECFSEESSVDLKAAFVSFYHFMKYVMVGRKNIAANLQSLLPDHPAVSAVSLREAYAEE